MAKRKMLRFGGPALPEGKHTWYNRKRPGDAVGKLGVLQVMVFPGDMIPADVVVKETGLTDAEGNIELVPNADYYVKAGMACIVDEESIDETAVSQ